MVVISDTSAISSLLQVGQERLLLELYARVVIPKEVQKELLAFHPAIPSFIEVTSIKDARKVAELLTQLDAGEAEAIVLAEEMMADALIVDDLDAREIAFERGIPVIGLLGVLATARRKGLLKSLRSLIDELETKANFRISAELRERVLGSVGE